MYTCIHISFGEILVSSHEKSLENAGFLPRKGDHLGETLFLAVEDYWSVQLVAQDLSALEQELM